MPGTQIQSDETEEFDEILRKIKPDCLNLFEELKRQLPDVEIVCSYGYAMPETTSAILTRRWRR